MQGKALHDDGQSLTHFRSEINVIGQLMGKLTDDISALTECLNAPSTQGNLQPTHESQVPELVYYATNPQGNSEAYHVAADQPTSGTNHCHCHQDLWCVPGGEEQVPEPWTDEGEVDNNYDPIMQTWGFVEPYPWDEPLDPRLNQLSDWDPHHDGGAIEVPANYDYSRWNSDLGGAPTECHANCCCDRWTTYPETEAANNPLCSDYPRWERHPDAVPAGDQLNYDIPRWELYPDKGPAGEHAC